MVEGNPVVLAVDDEPFNLELITDYLSEVNIETVCVQSGRKALTLLKEEPQYYSAVLLDRMMPELNGIDVLKIIKADESTSRIPVIMQTAKSGIDNMLEGLNAGAHYYLSKPYDQKTLTTIVLTAIRDFQHYKLIKENVDQSAQTLKLLNEGEFNFRTLKQARCLSALLAKACSEPDNIVFILTELMINAIEHGNLDISYKEKSKLIADHKWEDEVNKRLSLPSNLTKYAKIKFIRNTNEIIFTIIDQGKGFDWQQYMSVCPNRAFDTHGRGIAMANSISVNHIEYFGCGNTVQVKVVIGTKDD